MGTKRLNAAEVQRRLEELRSLAGDPEAFHFAEDTLHQDVLRAIRDDYLGATQARLCAREALKSLDINCLRQYA